MASLLREFHAANAIRVHFLQILICDEKITNEHVYMKMRARQARRSHTCKPLVKPDLLL